MIPKDVLEGVRELLINQGRLDGVTHEWRFAEPLPRILARPSHLEQVMVNLLLNALDALAGLRTPRIEVDVSRRIGGSVALVARRRDDPQGVDYRHRRRLAGVTGARGLTELPAQEVVVIRVADNGPGVPGDDVDRIFDPFFTTKPPGRGTGLGLAICARLVDDMGGRIEVENARSGGAVFSIHLPGLPVPEPVGAPAERMASALATREVSP